MMKNRKILKGVIIIAVLFVLVTLYIWTFVLGGRSLRTKTTATVDGQISYNADEEIEKAMQRVYDGCEEADIVGSDPSQPEKTIALAFYSLSDSTVNDKILRLLEEHGYPAAFFLTGLEVADNEDYVQNLVANGNELGSRGLKGISRAENETQADLVESFAHSKRVLTMLTDRTADLLYCENTIYTSAVRQAAYASGYGEVVFAAPENTLDYSNFGSQQEVNKYLSELAAGTLLMIRIDGKNEMIPEEPPVEPDVPAIDKQPDADVLQAETETEPEENALQLTEWLLKAMDAQGIRTVAVGNLSPLENPLQNGDKKALVYRSFLTSQPEAALALWNLPDSESLKEIAELLKQHEAGATFFVTEEEITHRIDELAVLEQEGFSLGNGGKNVAECAKLLDRAAGEKLMVWLPTDSFPIGKIYEEKELRQLAAAEGHVIAAPENPKQPRTGAFYGIDLSQPDAAGQLKALLEELQSSGLSAVDVKQAMEASGEIPAFTSNQMEMLRDQNAGKLEQAVDYVYTTEQALSFLFYGVRNQPVMRDICSHLKAHGATATFFATLDEMQQNSEVIELLLSEGHEIGIAYVESDLYPANFDSVARYLNSCVQYFQWRYGVELQTVFLPFDTANDEVKEAVSAMGLDLSGRNITIVKSDQKDLTVDGIPEIFETHLAKVSITRGSQVYFNADFYMSDQTLSDNETGKTVCGAVVDAVFENMIDPIAYRDPVTGKIAEESRYQVKTCSALRRSEKCYTLTTDLAECGIKESNSVVNSLDTNEEQLDYISERYIGTPAADSSAELPGFTWREIRKIDKTGRFTNEPVLFLTFDDWGTDASINHLLYVLEKYDIKATFFVRANYIGNNPNLLRTIAEAGHEVASHSYAHLPLAKWVESRSGYVSLTDEAAAELRTDVVKSYQELYAYIGDVKVDGTAALSKNFRPPTLAASRIGLTEVLDVGFDYIVSGDFSTHDYEAASVDELLNKFKNGIRIWNGRQRITNGSIIVMHMSEEACYTAQALDQMIPIWKDQGYSFERVDIGISRELSAHAIAEDER